LKRSEVTHGYCVREVAARRQLAEIVRRFDLAGSAAPFTRCLVCNEPLRAVDKEQVAERMPPVSRRHYDKVRECPGCRRLFWNGSHYRRMLALLEEVVQA
jgi:uncharacterized protein with PIN domain